MHNVGHGHTLVFFSLFSECPCPWPHHLLLPLCLLLDGLCWHTRTQPTQQLRSIRQWSPLWSLGETYIVYGIILSWQFISVFWNVLMLMTIHFLYVKCWLLKSFQHWVCCCSDKCCCRCPWFHYWVGILCDNLLLICIYSWGRYVCMYYCWN